MKICPFEIVSAISLLLRLPSALPRPCAQYCACVPPFHFGNPGVKRHCVCTTVSSVLHFPFDLAIGYWLLVIDFSLSTWLLVIESSAASVAHLALLNLGCRFATLCSPFYLAIGYWLLFFPFHLAIGYWLLNAALQESCFAPTGREIFFLFMMLPTFCPYGALKSKFST